jgi:uncharacterized protein (DUF924 family)
MSTPPPSTREPAWVDAVLRFWFDHAGPARWFARSDAFDQDLRQRFGALHAQVAAGEEPVSAATPRTALAGVLVLDQFSRNLHRGDARAFACDARARALADAAIAQGHADALAPAQRLFLYLPFEHSEDLADQQRSVALFEALGVDEWTRYARAHRDLVARFGRFPHRNAALGRVNTPREQAWLDAGGGF